MGRLILTGALTGGVDRLAPIDLISRLRDVKATEAACLVGATLAETALRQRDTVALAIPWTAAVAAAFEAVANGFAGAWVIDLRDDPRPTTPLDATAWRDLRLRLGKQEAMADPDDPQERLLLQAQMRKAAASGSALSGPDSAPALSSGRGLHAVLRAAIETGERPEGIRQRLGVGRSAFADWVVRNALDVRAALARPAGGIPEPAVTQAWDAILPSTSSSDHDSREVDSSEDVDLPPPRRPGASAPPISRATTMAQATTEMRQQNKRDRAAANSRGASRPRIEEGAEDIAALIDADQGMADDNIDDEED